MYKELDKLFPMLKLPVQEHFPEIRDSHLEIQLLKNPEILDDINNFKKVFSKNGKESFIKSKYKFIDTLSDFIINSKFYEYFNNDYKMEFNAPKKNKNHVVHFSTTNNIDDFYYIHVDIKSGNYNAFKYVANNYKESYDSANDSFTSDLLKTNSFEELFQVSIDRSGIILTDNEKEVFEIIKKSKPIRQVVMGKLNSKKSTDVLWRMITDFEKKFLNIINKYDISEDLITKIVQSQDEFTFAIPKSKFIDVSNFNNTFYKDLMEELSSLPVRVERYSFEIIKEIKSSSKFDSKLYHVETIYDIHNNVLFEKLCGVPKKIYIPMFRKYILKEPLQDTDLYSQDDGNIYKLVVL